LAKRAELNRHFRGGILEFEYQAPTIPGTPLI
jgi:hypothetical protein